MSSLYRLLKERENQTNVKDMQQQQQQQPRSTMEKQASIDVESHDSSHTVSTKILEVNSSSNLDEGIQTDTVNYEESSKFTDNQHDIEDSNQSSTTNHSNVTAPVINTADEVDDSTKPLKNSLPGCSKTSEIAGETCDKETVVTFLDQNTLEIERVNDSLAPNLPEDVVNDKPSGSINLNESYTNQTESEKNNEIHHDNNNTGSNVDKKSISDVDAENKVENLEGQQQREKNEANDNEKMEDNPEVSNGMPVQNTASEPTSSKLDEAVEQAVNDVAANEPDVTETKSKHMSSEALNIEKLAPDNSDQQTTDAKGCKNADENKSKTPSSESSSSECSEIDFSIIALPKSAYPTAKSIPIQAILEQCTVLTRMTSDSKSGSCEESLRNDSFDNNSFPVEQLLKCSQKQQNDIQSQEENNSVVSEVIKGTAKVTAESLNSNANQLRDIRLHLNEIGQGLEKLQQFSLTRFSDHSNSTSIVHSAQNLPYGLKLLRAHQQKKPFIRHISEGNNSPTEDPQLKQHNGKALAISCPNTSRMEFTNFPKILFEDFKSKYKKKLACTKVKHDKCDNSLPKLSLATAANVIDRFYVSKRNGTANKPTEILNKEQSKQEIFNKGKLSTKALVKETKEDPDIDQPENKLNRKRSFKLDNDENSSFSSEDQSLPKLKHNRPSTSPYKTVNSEKLVQPSSKSNSARNNARRYSQLHNQKVMPHHMHVSVIRRKIENEHSEQNKRSQTARTLRPTANIDGRKWSLITTYSTSDTCNYHLQNEVSKNLHNFNILKKRGEHSWNSEHYKNEHKRSTVSHSSRPLRSINEAGKTPFGDEEGASDAVPEIDLTNRPRLVKEDLWWSKN
uniref:Transcription termination factor 2 n=1 Tax=Syphacia muris TaxID=451379 RepID=A0A0N5ALG9_9BILA